MAVAAICEKASRRFREFCHVTDPNFRSPGHVRLMQDKLEAVEKGLVKRLIISMPPRHGKSETVSRKFPAWYLGRNPDKRIIQASYSFNLAKSFARDVRTIIETDIYRAVFSLAIDPEHRAVGDLNLFGHRGGIIAAGVGGSLTGHGAHLFLIDDPIKNSEEAESEVMREKQWDWFRSVALTRLEPNAVMIIMMTRWHQQDLVGKVLAQAKADGLEHEYEVLNLPAVAEENDALGRPVGEALWSDRYSAEHLATTKNKVGSKVWFSLYQGRPQDPETQIVKREWFRYYRELPIEFERFGGIDTATSVKTSADNSSLVDVCKDWEGYLYCDEVTLDKISVFGFAKHVNSAHTTKQYKLIRLEANNAGEAVKQRIEEVGRETKVNPPISAIQTVTDKVVRVNEFAHLIENGTLRFKAGNPRVLSLVEHLINFDGKGSDIDDDVDALGFAIKAALGGAGMLTDDWNK